jgi:hypothetical protein
MLMRWAWRLDPKGVDLYCEARVMQRRYEAAAVRLGQAMAKPITDFMEGLVRWTEQNL